VKHKVRLNKDRERISMGYFVFPEEDSGCVCEWNGIWKWNNTVADLIDMREKKKNVLYKKVKNFVL
jgi:isopenicillin N synthase-like dioxygenase